mmetsp:Transcript_21851/g.47548  ORF Transcript_21851/g.47548 Transcript_21851/m.47548 type:complete len:211 (-) Transcript_21851:2866-3498(-)
MIKLVPSEGAALGTSVGLTEGMVVGALLGAGETVGARDGVSLGAAVGGSVFRMHRFLRAEDNSSRLMAWIGRTPRSLAGLLSIIHSADPFWTLLSSPTPIASRSTFSLVRALISESYWVAAAEFLQLLGPRTQSWNFSSGTHLLSLPLHIVCRWPGARFISAHWTVPLSNQTLAVSVQYSSLSPSPRTFGSPSERKTNRLFRPLVAFFEK